MSHARNDQVRALGFRPAVCPDRRAAGLSRRRIRTAAGSRPSCSGSWWRWWARARPPWRSTGWWTPISTRAIRARTCATCPPGCWWRGFAWGFVAATSAVFFFAAGELNTLCLRLAPVALAIVFFYSFTKRFTSFSHLVLGLSLGIAPAAAWIAVRGIARPADSLADRGGDVLDGRLRRDLRLPGLRIRLRRGACAAFRALSASPARCAWLEGAARPDGGVPAGAGLQPAPGRAGAGGIVAAVTALLVLRTQPGESRTIFRA